MNRTSALSLLAVVFVAACATTPPVKMSEPDRLLGQESGVRLNAQMFVQNALQTIPITYEVENLRDTPIAIAEIVPETTFDTDELMLTIALGSEVPGNEFLPKLNVIKPGEKRAFTAKGNLNIGRVATSTAPPRYIRIKMNFLGQVAPFAQLVDIPEKAIHDPKLADELFPKWVEANETLITNSVPLRFSGTQRFDEPTTVRRPSRGAVSARP